MTVPVATATAAIAGIPQAAGHITLQVLLTTAGLAPLLPVLPYALELLALRRMTHLAFGTLMALEPAFGVLIGLLVLHQHPRLTQGLGITFVVVAAATAQPGGRRETSGRQEGTPGRSQLDLLG